MHVPKPLQVYQIRKRPNQTDKTSPHPQEDTGKGSFPPPVITQPEMRPKNVTTLCRSTRISKAPESFSVSEHSSFSAEIDAINVPKNHKAVPHWKRAMDDDFQALEGNETW